MARFAGVAATRYGWCMHNRFADNPSNSLFRNILRISPLNSKILQEFPPKPLIPIDTKIKSFSPRCRPSPFSENRELVFLIIAEIHPRECQTPDKPLHPTRTDPFPAVRLHAPLAAGRRDSAGRDTFSAICVRSAIMGFLSLAVSTNALPLRTEWEGESYW